MQAEGRGPSVWDIFTHRSTEITVSNDTGDVGCNEYYLYKQGALQIFAKMFGVLIMSDIARIAALGVPYYSTRVCQNS